MTGSADLMHSIESKVEKLIQLCEQHKSVNQKLHTDIEQLKIENQKIQSELTAKNSELQQKENRLHDLNHQVEVLKNAESIAQVTADKSSTEVKMKINEMMREIDNCISLLSKQVK